MLDQSGQQHPGQEGLARAGRAEDARRTLDQLIQVHADRVTLLEGVSQAEECAFLIPFLAEDFSDVAGLRQADLGMVRGDGLDRFGMDRFFQYLLEPAS